MSAVSRFFAALNEPKQIPQFVKLCNVVVAKMSAGAQFASPPVAYSVVTGHANDLEKAEEAAHKGPKGAAQDRDVKLGVVRSDMRLLKSFVQSIADSNMASAKAIIESSGFSVAKKPTLAKPPFAVRYGQVPGSAKLEAKSVGRKATYYWQMSADQKVWSDLPDTQVASTSVTGLTATTLYAFRFRTLTKAGLSDWSVVVTLIAH